MRPVFGTATDLIWDCRARRGLCSFTSVSLNPTRKDIYGCAHYDERRSERYPSFDYRKPYRRVGGISEGWRTPQCHMQQLTMPMIGLPDHTQLSGQFGFPVDGEAAGENGGGPIELAAAERHRVRTGNNDTIASLVDLRQ